MKESSFYSTYQNICSSTKLKSQLLIRNFHYFPLTGVCCELICIWPHCTNFLPQENFQGTKSKTTNSEVYWAANLTRSLRKNVLHKFLAFWDFLLSFYTWFFSLMFIFRTWKKINLWNTAHFLCQTNNPLCAGVDSITQLLSCVPRLKKLHLKMLWWCSVCERIPSVQETASLLKEYPNIVFNYCDHATIILDLSKKYMYHFCHLY